MFRRSLTVLALALSPRLVAAQGVATGAMQGTVVGQDGLPVAGATVRVIDMTSGRRWEIATRSDGRFLLETVAVGTYRVEVRALGFRPETRSGIVLALGQRLMVDFTLRWVAIELPGITVGARHAVPDRGRTGPAEVISRAAVGDLPNPGRSFLTLALLSPQVVSSPATPAVPTGGIAIGGQNRVYNSFQIDGGVEHDLYRGQLPGRQSFPRPISLEAIEEIQVLTAPFDVRHGNFAGGLVNLVTRSGGNAVHGSVFGYFADAALVRRRGNGGQVQPFTNWQFGGTVGGPIVRDRAHYFASADWQRRVVPDPGPLISDAAGSTDSSGIGISYASAARFRDILDTVYGLAPGSFGPLPGRVPARDVFGKVSVQLATNSHAEATYHYVSGNRQGFLLRAYEYYALSSFAQQEPSTTHAARLIWRSVFANRWSNELLLSYLRLRDECLPIANFPEMRVFVGQQAFLTAGASGTCPPSLLRQDVLELTDNAMLGLGRHALSVGLHGEVVRFRDDLVQGSPGLWVFSSVDSLEAGRARLYQRTLRGPSWDGGVDFHALHLAVYAQDRWNATPRLTLTAGLRLDVPVLPDAIPTNAPLRDSLGVDTGRLPSGNVLWSPRVGLNYDVQGDARTFVRGGIGLFSGRPLYRWLSNAYRDDGMQELFVDCRGSQMPAFDPVNQPTSCLSTPPRPRLSGFEPGARFPQNLKVALGADHRLFDVLVGTLDVVYTRSVHQLYVTDANLAPPSGVSSGEGDRPLYGTINPSTGAATPTRLSTAFGQVIQISSRDGDYALSLAAQLRTQTGRALEGSVLYAYTRARDRMSLAHVQARAMLEGTMLDGTLESRRLGISLFEIPHRVQLLATMRLPYRASIALLYSGASGRPFTYSVSGDANADGLGVNLFQDPVYVPRDSLDITLTNPADWPRLDGFITRVPCLRNQRGRILARNSCRNPWFGALSVRTTTAFPTFGGQMVHVSADLYNVLNLINGRWGLSRFDAGTFAAPLLVLRGYDASLGRGVYEFRQPPRDQIEDLGSRWQMELSVRYVF